jgi:hypothetical protein
MQPHKSLARRGTAVTAAGRAALREARGRPIRPGLASWPDTRVKDVPKTLIFSKAGSLYALSVSCP